MGKTTVSTALDSETLERLDTFCQLVHRTRAEVFRGLAYALLIDGKQFVYEDWRNTVTSKAR